MPQITAMTAIYLHLVDGQPPSKGWSSQCTVSASLGGDSQEMLTHPDMTFRIVKSIAASRGSWDIPGWFSMRSIEHQTFEQSNDWVPAFEETYSHRFG